jgi:hypothetical protein
MRLMMLGRQKYTAEPPVPELSTFELAIEKLKRHKSPGIDQIPVELIKAWGRTINYNNHKLIIAIRNKEELPEEWKESIIVPIYEGIFMEEEVHLGELPTVIFLQNVLQMDQQR